MDNAKQPAQDRWHGAPLSDIDEKLLFIGEWMRVHPDVRYHIENGSYGWFHVRFGVAGHEFQDALPGLDKVVNWTVKKILYLEQNIYARKDAKPSQDQGQS